MAQGDEGCRLVPSALRPDAEGEPMADAVPSTNVLTTYADSARCSCSESRRPTGCECGSKCYCGTDIVAGCAGPAMTSLSTSTPASEEITE